MENVYAAPAADVAEVSSARAVAPFYVVSPRKFLVLFGVTLGMYQLYWSYMHWARFRRHTGTPMWPVARAIFSVFFAHGLNSEIDGRLRRVGPYRWAPGALATLYVVASIVSTVADRMAAKSVGSPYSDVVGLAMLLPIGYSLWRTQRAANAACGDEAGVANDSLTWANYVWIAIGLMGWSLVLLGLYELMWGLELDVPA